MISRITALGGIIVALVGCEQPSKGAPDTSGPILYQSSGFIEDFNFDPLPIDDEGEVLVPWVTTEGRGEGAFGYPLRAPYLEYSARFEYIDENNKFPVDDLLKLVKAAFREAPKIQWASDPEYDYFYEAEYEGEAGQVGYVSLVFIPEISTKTVVIRYTMTEAPKR
jgi:hypothetical protein